MRRFEALADTGEYVDNLAKVYRYEKGIKYHSSEDGNIGILMYGGRQKKPHYLISGGKSNFMARIIQFWYGDSH
jgi:hypothetical protein